MVQNVVGRENKPEIRTNKYKTSKARGNEACQYVHLLEESKQHVNGQVGIMHIKELYMVRSPL